MKQHGQVGARQLGINEGRGGGIRPRLHRLSSENGMQRFPQTLSGTLLCNVMAPNRKSKCFIPNVSESMGRD